MFSAARELQVAAALSTGDYAAGLSGKNMDFDFQTAFSLTEHLGLMGNYSFTDAGHHDRHPSQQRRHRFGEGGLGYYSNSGGTYFEFFTGFGSGYGNTTYEDACNAPIPDPDTPYSRFFLQPALGLKKTSQHLAFVSRFSMVYFSNYGQGHEQLSLFFIEPAVLGKINLLNNQLYVQWQAGVSLSGSRAYPGRCLDDVPFNFSFGVGARLGAFKNNGGLAY